MSQKQRKRKMINILFKYLPKLLVGEYKKIIHQNKSLGIWILELKLRENYSHKNKGI
jgi:hypothetical protein